jgi:hypothetical protein
MQTTVGILARPHRLPPALSPPYTCLSSPPSTAPSSRAPPPPSSRSLRSLAREEAVMRARRRSGSNDDGRMPTAQHTSAYVSIRQHTSAYVSIRQHTSACVSMRQHTSVMRGGEAAVAMPSVCLQLALGSAYFRTNGTHALQEAAERQQTYTCA